MHRKSLLFLAGRIIPAAITLAAVALYTHWVPPEEYGRYAYYLVLANLLNLGGFQWLRVSVLRFAAGETSDMGRVKSTALATFLTLAATAFLLASLNWMIFAHERPARLIFLATVLGLSIAWAELNQEWQRAKLAALAYGALQMARALLALGATLGFIKLGWGAEGLFCGLIMGNLLPALLLAKGIWASVHWAGFDKAMQRRWISYGAPLALTFALSSLIAGMDRLLLAHFYTLKEVGPYAVAYDIARNSLFLLAQASNLAAFPLAVKALEQTGAQAARLQLQKNLGFLLALMLPATLGLVLVGPRLCELFIAPEYTEITSALLLPLALSTLLVSLKTFYSDQSFMLGHETHLQLKIALISALVCLISGLLLIPRFGALGTGWSGVITFALGLSLSWRWGRKVFALPLPGVEIWKLLAACTTLMLGCGLGLILSDGLGGLVLSIAFGGSAYLLTLLTLNYEDYGHKLRQFLRA